MTNQFSRRAFLRSVSDSAQASLVVLSAPAALLAGQQAHAAMVAGADFTTLEPEEAAEFAAIAARIFPTDETPGATEAGVIFFMDRVLGAERAELLAELRTGLADLQAFAAANYGGTGFADRPVAQQDALLHGIEQSSFFTTMRYLTIAGMFASPARGGNRGEAGWQLLGFEDRHTWQSPYGYYDGQQMDTAD
jgi:gluconate 2-dehydrogenase gamma chain